MFIICECGNIAIIQKYERVLENRIDHAMYPVIQLQCKIAYVE